MTFRRERRLESRIKTSDIDKGTNDYSYKIQQLEHWRCSLLLTFWFSFWCVCVCVCVGGGGGVIGKFSDYKNVFYKCRNFVPRIVGEVYRLVSMCCYSVSVKRQASMRRPLSLTYPESGPVSKYRAQFR